MLFIGNNLCQRLLLLPLNLLNLNLGSFELFIELPNFSFLVMKLVLDSVDAFFVLVDLLPLLINDFFH